MGLIPVGNGQPGLISGRRDFGDFLDLTDPTRDVFVTLKPIQQISNWALDQGATYVSTFELLFKNIRRDICGVKTLLDGSLTRAESLANCRATAGTFFYDVDEEFSFDSGTWDDGVNVWQIASWLLDGTNDYLLRGGGLTGAVDGKVGTVHGWFKSSATGAEQIILASTGENFKVALTAAGLLEISGESSGGTDVLVLTSTSALNDGSWHEFLATWDLASAAGELYVDTVDSLAGGATLTNTDIDWTVADWAVGADVVGGSKFNGELGQLYLELSNQDASLQATRDKFIKAVNSMPTDLGQDGSNPTGSQPILMLNQSYDNPLENTGTGGDFETHNGAIAQGITTPTHPKNALRYDQFSRLFVHLGDGSNPDDTTVVAVFAFYYANRGMWQPSLSPNRLTNGGFESNDFDDSTAPTSWTRTNTTGTPVLTRGTSLPKEGSQYPICTLDASEVLTLDQSLAASTMISGATYRISGYYSTQGDADAKVQINDGSSGNYMLSDGRNVSGSSTFHTLNRTGSKWRRFVMDFIAPSAYTGTTELVLRAEAGSAGGVVRWDEVQIQRVWRYNFHEPRLTSASLPPTNTASKDIYFGSKSVGSGSVALINADGLIEETVGELEWMNAEALIDVGGTFRDPVATINNQEIDKQNQFRQMTGLIQDVDIDDAMAEFKLQDKRVFFHQKLPIEIYDDGTFTNLESGAQGKPRPIFFGQKENISPVRVALTSGNLYGQYEICNTAKAPNGIKSIDAVYAYESTADAADERTDRRIQLTSVTDYTEDLVNGQFTVIRDVGPYIVNATNKFLNFNEGAAELTATLTEGVYTAQGLAAEIQTQLIAAGAADWTCTYSNTTHKFTIAKGAGTAQLLTQTGTDTAADAYALIGFSKSADKTGALSYEGDDVTFEDVDRDHVIRCDAKGYKDDGSGTFTGTADALINKGADILRTLLINWLDKEATIIDETSFVAARTRGPEALSVFLNTVVSTRDIFDTLEFSNIANIIVNGEGNIFYNVYITGTPEDIPILADKDFLFFKSGLSSNEVFTTIKINYDQDPTTGRFEAREKTDESVSLRLGRPELKTFNTYIKLADNALNVATRMLGLASAAPRKIMGSVQGSTMMNREVGDKFQMSRARALAQGGAISDEVFRIISLSKNGLTGRVDFIATDDASSAAAAACTANCQANCQQVAENP